MGDEKPLVGGIAAEAPADVVIQPAPEHLRQRPLCHLQAVLVSPSPVVCQEEQKIVGGGKFRRAVQDLLPRGQQRGTVPLPLLVNSRQKLLEAHHAAQAAFGEVSPSEKGPLLRRQENAGRPPAVSGERLTDRHIDAVQVGPLLPVHFNRDKPAVQQCCGLGVLEALMGHDVAPVAGAIADTEEDGLVLLTGPEERLLTPGIPVHRILRVLEEVGAGFVLQMVGHRFTSFLPLG